MNAIADAVFTSEGLIPDVDPHQKTMLSVTALGAASLAGLPYLSSPYAANSTGLSYISILTSQALQISLQQTPSVAKAIWPPYTQDSPNIQINPTIFFGTNVTDLMGTLLTNALQLIMNDVPTFLSFAETGAYTNSTLLSLPSRIAGLSLALETYIVSSALSANGYVARVVNGSQTLSSSWSDSATGLTYTMGSTVMGKDRPPQSNLANVFNNDGTTPEALYPGPYACAEEGLFDGGSVVSDGLGVLDLSCVSRLMECKSDGDGGVDPQGKLESCPKEWAALS